MALGTHIVTKLPQGSSSVGDPVAFPAANFSQSLGESFSLRKEGAPIFRKVLDALGKFGTHGL